MIRNVWHGHDPMRLYAGFVGLDDLIDRHDGGDADATAELTARVAEVFLGPDPCNDPIASLNEFNVWLTGVKEKTGWLADLVGCGVQVPGLQYEDLVGLWLNRERTRMQRVHTAVLAGEILAGATPPLDYFALFADGPADTTRMAEQNLLDGVF